ncbi:DUF4815 domain-containing protein [Ectopseudomonas khazarica]|uniref:DUF4815 domain-containing protein n=1 Tax=Ectopseudomonas khazarica TaxID=2502979 RepID=UPI001AEFD5C2|nr:DUF4815 domain-containing protein [Pseudomonas khazarica]QTS88872.1 DUF4815 domain-containing protein [Pseudomonas khazarica]
MTEHYDRFDQAKNYDRHLFRPDRILQSAEFNELQSAEHQRLKGIADVLLKDGDIIRDAGLVLDLETGHATLEAGAIYLDGAVRGIAPAALTVPLVGTVTIGAFMLSEVITAQDDPALLNPAAGTRGYNEPGADRLRLTPTWGLEGSRNDAEFFPVYTVVDGNVRQKSAPPNLDVVAQAIARYDRDSTDGCYVVRGLVAELLSSTPEDSQTWLINAGRARINGFGVELATSRRIIYDAQPDLRLIASEPHLMAGPARQRINVNRPAIAEVVTLQITAERTVDVVHGAYVGAADVLPDNSVISIERVWQGTTEYAAAADYTLGAAAVDWAPAGAEPATGSTYKVTYRYIASPEALDPDDTGLYVEGAVAGTLALVTYRAKLPRIDRLCLDEGGGAVWVRGVSALDNPVAPNVPANLLSIATVRQTWLPATRSVTADGARMVPMYTLGRMQAMIDEVYQRVAEQRLLSDANVRDQGIRRGVFVDPFLSDDMRDAGIEQSAAIVDGELVLPITATGLATASADVTSPQRCPSVPRVAVEQVARTGAMKVNSYGAQLPMPARVTLEPAVDRWTETETVWASPVTKRIAMPTGQHPHRWYTGNYVTSTQVTSSVSTEAIWTLRQIDVAFELQGFGAGERLIRVVFDGIDVTPVPILSANGQGVVNGAFHIPEGVTSGRKTVFFVGEGGSRGEAEYYGEGTREIEEKQQVTTESPEYVISFSDPTQTTTPTVYPPGLGPENFASTQAWVTRLKIYEMQNGTCILDPLAQTLRVDKLCQVESVDLMLTTLGADGKDILVQLRTTASGMPSTAVLAEARITPQATGVLNVTFDMPALLWPGLEYAIVVLTDSNEHELAIATLGAYDQDGGAWVSAQPYQIGVLLSSANAVTWTAHQDRDLWFRLNVAQYTATQRTIDLGTLDVEDVTDCVFIAGGVSPSPEATVDYSLTLPDGSVLPAADLQAIQFPAPVTGEIAVSAHLRASEGVSGILRGPTQLALGVLQPGGTYVSRAIPAGANVRLRVVFDAVLPAGSNVAAEYQVDAGAWQACDAPTAKALGNGALELSSVTAGITGAVVRVRLTLTGTPAARPRVRDLRVIVSE